MKILLPVTIAALIFLFANAVHAQTPTQPEVFDVAIDRGTEIFEGSRIILEGLGMLSVLGIGAMALMGRLPWGWAFALIGGLAIVMLAGSIANWITTDVAGNATAQDFGEVSQTVRGASQALFVDAKTLLYSLAGLGTIGLGALGLFGKFRWSWLFALIAGLIIIGAAAAIVGNFITFTSN